MTDHSIRGDCRNSNISPHSRSIDEFFRQIRVCRSSFSKSWSITQCVCSTTVPLFFVSHSASTATEPPRSWLFTRERQSIHVRLWVRTVSAFHFFRSAAGGAEQLRPRKTHVYNHSIDFQSRKPGCTYDDKLFHDPHPDLFADRPRMNDQDAINGASLSNRS